MIKWQEIFSKDGFHWQDAYTTSEPVVIARLDELKRFLDAVHIRFCLVKPYQEHKNYPLVEGRELLPSFDNDMFEYKDLPGFSMVAFARQLDYFSETFQFDKLHPIVMEADGACCPLENQVLARNVQTLASRLPRMHQDIFRQQFANADTVILDNYPSLMPYLLAMDRAQVLALDADRQFHLAGVFASFPSDIDSELKRFGMRIGKFVYGDSEIYERNRMFVYQYLMELYGFPIVSERRTSSALFARKLHKLGEHFTGTISGVTGFGIFVQLDDLFIEGLVHIGELGHDYYHFDEVRHELKGESSGVRYQLTDRVIVQVSRVDMDARQIDLRLIDGPFKASDKKEGETVNTEPAQHVIFDRYKKRNIATLTDKDEKVEGRPFSRRRKSR